MALVDHRGVPFNPKTADQAIGRPGRAGPRPWKYGSVATGLTPTKLAGILKKADEGDATELLTLAEELERRDSHAGAQLRTRRLALAGLPWIVEAATDDKRDVDIAAELQAIVNGYAFSGLVFDMLDGILKPFAVSEIIWSRGERWKPVAFHWRDQRSFAIDPEDGRTLRLRTEAQPKEGEDLAAWKFICHTPRMFSGPVIKSGLVRPLSVMYSLKTLGLSSWLAYMEIFGIPWRIGRFNSSATDEEKDTLAEALQMLGMDGSVVLPTSVQLEVQNAVGGGAGSDIHQRLADWADRQMSKAVIGQTMTADNGSSKSQADVHNLVRRDILVADAIDAQATLQRDFIEPYCLINYGELDVYPRIRCQTEEPEDRKLFVETVGPMVDRGLKVQQSVVRDRLGLEEPDENAEEEEFLRPVKGAAAGAGTPPGPPPASAPTKSKNGEQRLAALIDLLAEDDVDFITAEGDAPDWRTTMKTLRDAVAGAARETAQAGGTYSTFLAKLEAKDVDVTKLVRSLALKTLGARGMGDATDDVT